MKLSILICSLEYRRNIRIALMDHLAKQYNGPDVQIIVNEDNKQKTTGKKRQELLLQAKGDYVVFIDDDDWVHDWYIEEMLKACDSGADCFAINGTMTTDGQHETVWKISKDYQNENRIEGNKTVYYRHTNHITGVKRHIALNAGFPDKSNAEDKYYSDRLILRTEYKIEKPMYIYRFSTQNKQYV